MVRARPPGARRQGRQRLARGDVRADRATAARRHGREGDGRGGGKGGGRLGAATAVRPCMCRRWQDVCASVEVVTAALSHLLCCCCSLLLCVCGRAPAHLYRQWARLPTPEPPVRCGAPAAPVPTSSPAIATKPDHRRSPPSLPRPLRGGTFGRSCRDARKLFQVRDSNDAASHNCCLCVFCLTHLRSVVPPLVAAAGPHFLAPRPLRESNFRDTRTSVSAPLPAGFPPPPPRPAARASNPPPPP